MRWRHLCVGIILAVSGFAPQAVAQSQGENIDLWHRVKTGSQFSADSLWMGGVFLRDSTKPLIVWFHYNEAGYTGRLYFMKKNGDSVFCFTNQQGAASVNLTALGHDAGFRNMDTIVFMYRIVTGEPQAQGFENIRYTGPNRRLGDAAAEGGPYVGADRFTSNILHTGDLGGVNTGLSPKRRWSVAGWVRVNNARTDTVEFGFEDRTPGDADFDDIVFHVYGVFLNGPPFSKEIKLEAQPSTTIRAGDSVTFTARVYLDSVDMFGVHHVINRPQYDAQVRWDLQMPPGTVNPPLKFGVGPRGINVFYGQQAWRTYTVTARFVDALGVTQTATMTVTVTPGPADHIVIESSDDSTGKLWSNSPRDLLVLGAADTASEAFYAIVRDRYNNWIGPAYPATWSSANTSIVTARAGARPTRGQGHVSRATADTGRALITARYVDPSSGRTLTDDMLVRLDRVTYSNIEIGVIVDGTFRKISRLDMKTTQDTVLWVRATRSDNGQVEYIDATWSASNLQLDPGSAQGQKWAFTPLRPSTGGTITATTRATASGQPISVSIPVVIKQGEPYNMRLYSQAGNPFAQPPLQTLPQTISVVAGVNTPIVAKLFDELNEWLADYETVDSLRNKIHWQVSDPANAQVTPVNGHLTTFRSTVAWSTYTVTASYVGDTVLTRTIQIYVSPGPATQLVIEPTPDADASRNKANPYGTMTITSEETVKRAYAVLRDQYGNYVSPSRRTTWTSADAGVVTAANGDIDTGMGLVTRVSSSGQTTVTARDSATGLSGNLSVTVLQYYYTALQIFVGTFPGTEIAQLTINTNQDSTIKVKGRRSDNGTWEAVSATWQASQSLANAVTAPGDAPQWVVSPTDTAHGWVRVTMNDDARTLPDTIQVTFTPGPPTSVTMSITTPADQLIAGDPVTATLTIRNKDGNLVAGQWCADQALFDDLLSGGVYPDSIIVNGVRMPLDQAVANLCFQGGTTQVSLILHYAPANNAAHTVRVTLTDATVPTAGITDDTDPFILKPGPLARIQIERNNASIDTLVMQAPDDIVALITKGFDAWGNPRGNELANWSVSYGGGLPPITNPTNVSRILYNVSSVDSAANGWIRAVAPGGGTISDSVRVTVLAPPIGLASTPLTLDRNGNGLLDGFAVEFKHPATIPTEPNAMQSFLMGFTVLDPNGTSWTVTNITCASGCSYDSVARTMTGTSFVVEMEETSPSLPQTGWRPEISFAGYGSHLGSFSIPQAADGAGPVIWSVTKFVEEDKEDRIEVAMSEQIRTPSGEPITDIVDTLMASHLFEVWVRNRTTGAFEPAPAGILDSIRISGVVDDSIFVFDMSNGEDLLANQHWLDVAFHLDNSGAEPDSVALFGDDVDVGQTPNRPPLNNQKVIVTIKGTIGPNPTPFPNPLQADARLVPAGQMTALTNPQARAAVLSRTNGGVVTTFDLTVPEAGVKVKAERRIYDIVGNLVQTAAAADLLTDYKNVMGVSELPTSITIDFYWNGFNKKGMPCAPGVYREILLVSYVGGSNEQYRATVSYGIVR